MKTEERKALLFRAFDELATVAYLSTSDEKYRVIVVVRKLLNVYPISLGNDTAHVNNAKELLYSIRAKTHAYEVSQSISLHLEKALSHLLGQ